MSWGSRTGVAVALVLGVTGLILVLLPVGGLVVRAPWSNVAEALSSPGALTALVLSIQVSTSAAVLALALGFPLAWLLARPPFPGRSLIRAIVILPLVLPPVVGGVALLTALGRRGVAGRVLAALGIELPFTTAGAVVAATFVCFPLLVLALEGGLASLDRRLEQASATLGASPWYTLRRVTVPLLRPQIVAGLVLAWARALGEFGATITFAGNLRGRTQTLPLAVFEALQSDPGSAITLSLILVLLSLIVLVALRGRFLAGR